MPRKPITRRSLRPKPRPCMFSSFGRSVARLSSVFVPKNGFHDNVKSSPEGKNVTKEIVKDDNERSDDEEFDVSGVVQADFLFFDPKPDDFHGVKMLLQTYLDDKEWDLSGFVDMILEQPTVGTVIKVEGAEDEGIFAVISALNLERYKDHRSIKDIKEYLFDVCRQEPGISKKLKRLISERAHSVALLVSQRVFNLPPQLLPPLYDGLFDEISWATEDEPTEELRKSFQFKMYLIVTRIYKTSKSSSSNDPAIVFVKPEEEIFLKRSSWSFTYALHTGPPVPPELRNYRLMGMVMAVEANKIPSFRQQLKSLIE